MENRSLGFVTLMFVVGVSIVFGMVVGGWLNTPRVALAAQGVALDAGPIRLAPAVSGSGTSIDFADVVEAALPAVVGVTSTRSSTGGGGSAPAHPFLDDPFFRRFFQREPDGDEPTPPRTPNDRPRVGEGSGFFISDDGYLLTNNHVVDGADRIEVTLEGGRQYEAQLVGADPSIDLALLKIDADGRRMPTLPLGDSRALRLGEWVIAIGNPLEFDLTVTLGIISGKERRVPIGATDSAVVTFLQTDAAINFGNSGGPLIDSRGNVIGINTAIRRADFAEGIGFALPINQARAVVEQLRERGYVRRGFVGISMNDAGIDEAAREYYGLPDTNGVIVSNVQPDGPAESAGMRAGDIIRAVDGEVVRDNYDLVAKIASRQPGDSVAIDVYRSGELVRLKATLQDRQEGLEASFGDGEGPGSSERPDEQGQPDGASAMGISVESLDGEARERLGLGPVQTGVLVTRVEFDSDAADRGVVPMMIVTAVNDRPVESVADWLAAFDDLRPGRPIKLDLLLPQPGDRAPLRRFVYLTPGD